MVDVNVALQDAATRHQVFLQRFGGSSANESIKILNKAERDLRERLKKRLKRLGPVDRQIFGQGLVTTKRMQAMIEEVRIQNRDLRVALGKSLRGNLKDLAGAEIDVANRRMTEAFGVDLNNLRPSPEVMRSLSQLKNVRLRGRTLGQWFNKFEADRFARVESAIRLGVVEGDTIPQIVRRLRLAGEASKVSANALVRTSMNHVANTAREAFYDANSDLIKEVRWTATLDGRTSPICRARDGLTWAIDEPHPRPPAHPNCRSILAPITKSWEELTGGKVKLDPKRMQGPDFEKAMRKGLKAKGLNPDQIDDFIKAKRLQLSGKVAPTDTYENWLTAQPAKFQDEILGRQKGALFRRGGLELDKFVDMNTGKPFNLEQLRAMEAKSWAKAFPKGTGRAKNLPLIPQEDFSAARFAKRFDDPNVTPEKVMARFDDKVKNTILKYEKDIDKLDAAGKFTEVQFKTQRVGLKNSVWAQERRKDHKRIIRRLLTKDNALTRALPAAGEQPSYVTFGGRGGSGKSWFTEAGNVIDKDKFFIVDADKIKRMLPEYKGWNAAQIHEESSDILALMTRYARRKGLNIVNDATLKSTKRAVDQIEGMIKNGYRTEGYYMFLPRQEAAFRAVKRAVGDTKRYVPVNIVLDNTTNEVSFDAVKHLFSKWQFYDNQVARGLDPILIGSSF